MKPPTPPVLTSPDADDTFVDSPMTNPDKRGRCLGDANKRSRSGRHELVPLPVAVREEADRLEEATLTPQAKGGLARAANMTDEERSDAARKAALARWGKEDPASNPPTFVLRSLHPEDGRPRYLAVSTDRTSKGTVIDWSPFWSVDPSMAFPFQDRREAACVQAQYGASATEIEGMLYDNAVIVPRKSRLKEKP